MGRAARYSEGDWFAVPLRAGGYGVGLLTRANRQGVLLGYFFGPRRGHLPSLEELDQLSPDDACLAGKFGHLGLVTGKWQILGRLPSWDRASWPVPVFARHEELTGRWMSVTYDDSDPSKIVDQRQVSADFARGKPRDGLMGPGYVERLLTQMLGGSMLA